ncbi:MAG: acyl-CoA dehydrogenase family protein, partial [Candidatus Omnitrophica bacterium]|nr:acyl-CoA dehydrogenase family protein [Candidatus Omnitrophota bacterium]
MSMEPAATDPHALLGKGSPEALEVTEAAREVEWRHPSVVADLFMGRARFDLVFPFPEQDPADRQIGDEFLARLTPFLKAQVDPDEIDRTGELPPQVIQGLARLGCFGMKIPSAYGGLGLSQTNYNRVIALLGSYCGS